jgi:tetratricopeptide (TPR) repeat protein
MPLQKLPLLPLLIALLSLSACSDAEPPSEPVGAPIEQSADFTMPPEAIAGNNRGVGLMGSFRYEDARSQFQELSEQYPDWLDVRVNLAIATLNRQQPGDEQAALELVGEVLAADPAHLRAHYVSGLLHLYLSSPAVAQPHFERVANADPDDAYAAYYLAQCLAQQGEYAGALARYQQAMAVDPYLRSAYYGAFQAQQRLGDREAARALIDDYQRLDANPRSRLAEFKYTRMGPKAEALAVDAASPAPTERPQGNLFAEPRKLAETGLDRDAPASLTPVDLNGDGVLELYLAGGSNPGLLLRGETDGSYRPEPGHALAQVKDVNATLWGDYDNDGLVDAYLCRQGPNQLWRQQAPGEWVDVSAATGTANAGWNTLDGAFVDADHDGDLDLFLVNADAPNELLNNNLDGSFRPLGVERGVSGGARASRGLLALDIDRDRDLDLLVVHAEPPHELFLNDRLWAYRPAEGFDAVLETPLLAIIGADLDADGWPELIGAGIDGRLKQWRREPETGWVASDLGPLGSTDSAWAQLAVLDADGDGSLELLDAGAAGWTLRDGAGRILAADGDPLAGLSPAVIDPSQGPGLLTLAPDGALALHPPGPGRFSYLALSLSGREDQAQSMRSNASGLGAGVALRVDSRWTVRDYLRPLSGPGQGLQPLAFGLGGAERADFVAIDWSDGVFQSELDLAAGQQHRITETQRQLSSCPVLFVWDGSGYRFVTDLLGVGGIGYAVGPGEYAPPRPWENLLLPAGLARPADGRYRLKLSEPMEEALYLDSARLRAYDLPPGWQLVLDERMGVLGPEPTGEPRYYRRELLPARAVNERGEEVTTQLLAADGEAAPVGDLDHRFIGRLKGRHRLELHFDRPLDEASGRPMLVVDGWVEYPYSQTSFAAWQANAGFEAPTLEVQDGAGDWQPLLGQFGYPAGMPRRMSVPLPALPAGARALRLSTNMEVYWDRLALAWSEPLPAAASRLLPLADARVAKTGFARRTTHAQRRPEYDYSRRSPFWDARYMPGNYTNLGPAQALVARTDNALAIIGAGEEVHLEFAAELPPLPAGWNRRLVLETNGWAKDMDLFTKDGETLGPLPSMGEPGEQVSRLHRQYNQRYQAGR